MNISVIVPLLNEDESLRELAAWIQKVVTENKFSYEIIFVDDGSTDDSWNVVKTLSEEDEHIKGIRLRRNYGKSAALFCGFKEAIGDVVFTMDADLQDSPDEIPGMYDMIVKQKYDMVSGWKKTRHDPFSKRIPSKLWNRIARSVSGIKLHDFNCGLKAYKKDVIKNIEVYGEMHRYMPVLAKNAGFSRIGERVVQHKARKYGVTKFGGITRFFNGILDLMSINFIMKFGKRPMHLFGTLGILMFFVGFLASAWLGGQKLYYLNQNIPAKLLTDSPYFYLALVCMVLGTQLFLSGFLGELISRTSRDRNTYQIDEKI